MNFSVQFDVRGGSGRPIEPSYTARAHGLMCAGRLGRFLPKFFTCHIWVVFNYIWNRVYAFIPSRTAGGFCQRIHGKSEMVRGRRSGALRRSYFPDLTFLEKSSSSDFSSSSSSFAFFRKVLSGFRQSRGPTEQRESRGCSGAHFTFFSAQANKWYPRREQVDSFTDTVFSRPLRRRTHSKNESTGCK